MRIFNVYNGDDLGPTGVWTFEGKNDGNQVHDEYTDWSNDGADFWRISNDFARNGSLSSTVKVVEDTTYTAYYDIPADDQSKKLTLEWFIYFPDDLIAAGNRLGFRHTFRINGIRIAEFWNQLDKPVGNNRWIGIISAYSISGGFEGQDSDTGNLTVGEWNGFRMIADLGKKTLEIYHDRGDSGTWVLKNSMSWTSSINEPFDRMDFTSDGNEYGAGTYAYEKFFIDDLSIEPGSRTGDEITPAPLTAKCSKKMEGRGMFSASIHDFELANYATTKLLVWPPIEVWSNDLAVKLGEYFCPKPRYRYNSYLLAGPEALGVLHGVSSGYNGILAQGEATAIGADTLTDSNAAFTAALLAKICMFTDKVSPSIEVDYPVASSDHHLVSDDNPLDPLSESGANTDLDTVDGIWSVRADVPDNAFYLKLVYEVTNGATATAFNYQLNSFNSRWTVGNDAEIHIYDFTNTQWRKVADLECDNKWVTYYMDESDIPAGVISDYYSGDTPPEFHVKILSGVKTGYICDMQTSFAELKTTYSTLFAAEQNNYTVDIQTATQLDFTDQTPQADGPAAGDRYVIGDLLHNIVPLMSKRAIETNLTLDYGTSTKADAADYRTSMIGDILSSFAKMDNRRYWQQIGWVAQSLATGSLVSTGLTLTEADLVVNNDMEKWEIGRDGTEMRRHQMVVGNGNFAEEFQTPTFPCPLSDLYTSNLISSQVIAKAHADSRLARYQGPKDIFECTVDHNNIAGTDYTSIDNGKTININLYSGTFTITNGMIISIENDDSGANGHLLRTMQVETI